MREFQERQLQHLGTITSESATSTSSTSTTDFAQPYSIASCSDKQIYSNHYFS